MNDKELFDFFKTNSARFDEAPPEELWQKIRTRSVRRKWNKPQASRLFLTLLLFAVILIIGICMTIFFFERK